MKKNKFTEFLKGKGYYVLLFVGVVAIATVAIIGSQLSSEQKDQGDSIVDLNAPDDNIAAVEDDTEQAENNPVSEGIVNNANNSANDTAAKDNSGQVVASNEDLIEYEGDYGEVNVPVLPEATVPEVVAEVVKEEPAAVETAGTTVQADTTSVTDSLKFKAEEGLLWPVKGDVIMNYSMDHTIYHATLMQYKCNPAIIIDAEVGTEVMAAANGIVSSIDTDNEETGFTITMNLGDGYSVVYGQLGNVGLEVGDKVNEGDVIGTVDEPTKYYTIEGSNLYFEVLENEQTINPMLLLR